MADLAHAAEDDTDLHGDTDARNWAERFVYVRAARLVQDGFDIAADPGTMLTWFAGAIETGRMAAKPPPRHGIRNWAEPHLNSSWIARCICGRDWVNLRDEGANAKLQQHLADKIFGHGSDVVRHEVSSWACLRPDRRDWAAQCTCSVQRTGYRQETANAALLMHFEEELAHAG
jgi:hypothetical protein